MSATPEELDLLRAQVRDPDSLARKLSGIANDAANRVPESMPGLASIAGDLAVYDAGKATGYAEAVADIRQLVLTAANRQSAEMFRAKGAVLRRIYGTVSESLFGLLEAIAAGAHVGAAKKGAT